jgi:hypothetical protein
VGAGSSGLSGPRKYGSKADIRGRPRQRGLEAFSRDRVFVTGTQAVIRMLLMQQARDRAAGLNTAGFVRG